MSWPHLALDTLFDWDLRWIYKFYYFISPFPFCHFFFILLLAWGWGAEWLKCFFIHTYKLQNTFILTSYNDLSVWYSLKQIQTRKVPWWLHQSDINRLTTLKRECKENQLQVNKTETRPPTRRLESHIDLVYLVYYVGVLVSFIWFILQASYFCIRVSSTMLIKIMIYMIAACKKHKPKKS